MKLSQQGLFTTRHYEILADSLLIKTNGYFRNETKQIPFEQVLVEERFKKNQVDTSLIGLTILAGILITLLILTQFRVYTMMDLLVVISGISVMTIIGIRFLNSSTKPQIIIPAGNVGYVEILVDKPSSEQVIDFITTLDQTLRDYLRAKYAVITSDNSLNNQLSDYSWLHGRKMISQEEYFQLTTEARKLL